MTNEINEFSNFWIASYILTLQSFFSERSQPQLPEGFETRLRANNQSLVYWHAKGETTNLLFMGLGTAIIYRLLPTNIKSFEYYALGAGVLTDLTTSQNWTDLTFRLGGRLPLHYWRNYFPSDILSYHFMAIENLLLEAPNLSLGVIELLKQRKQIYQDINHIIPGSGFDKQHLHISLHPEENGTLQIHFPKAKVTICGEADDPSLFPEEPLAKLVCQSQKLNIKQLNIIPLEGKKPHLQVTAFHRAIASNRYHRAT
ncbi:hypothetical protein [Parendozoicomonas sp. Alg238-R29]|uniref:hypothetical protein n=1 Tax=Parendozoicomonas sp. Alg238-R29 TaxID=2993446 RepID=UPI00248EF191|nr:hypothetical protein [Parendozoicomonas sp. Alg238-R29]